MTVPIRLCWLSDLALQGDPRVEHNGAGKRVTTESIRLEPARRLIFRVQNRSADADRDAVGRYHRHRHDTPTLGRLLVHPGFEILGIRRCCFHHSLGLRHLETTNLLAIAFSVMQLG
jgi:hypothetical protein